MESRNLEEDRILAALLESDDELICEDIDSEAENHESEDDVQSDIEEAFVDEEREEEPTPGENEPLGKERIEQPASSLVFH